MVVRQWLRARFRRFLQRPGTTVNLAPFEALLPAITDRTDRLTDLTDAELTAAARDLRAAGRDPAATDTLVEVCALAREAGRRGLGQRAFDVQLVGALAMLAGHVAEMATGEGKTLTAAVTAFGFALRGGPVHVLTVNDYLARRDAEWMAPVYRLLGLTVGSIGETSSPARRREVYGRDVTYVSVSEAGYDYLRDRLAVDPAEPVQRELAAVIVDEADSILIDEARVPLVLAGAVSDDPLPLAAAADIARHLQPGRHYQVADDQRSVQLTTSGLTTVESELGGINLYAPDHLEQLTALNVALYAEALLRRDVDYIVRDGKVDLVDEFRGRVAQHRRWPDGLQAAVEAKEGLAATEQGEVLGTITVQSLIRLYPTTCGMTATGALVGEQLREFYRLEVAVIPPNTPRIRVDEPDRVYATRKLKEAALIAEVTAAHTAGRPVLIGTLDVAESERIAAALQAADVGCVVLNAKNDAEEAEIIAEAGMPGAVTVSTQMAGRGIDIRLGGSGQADRDRVVELGGLYVIGTGRHDSRRVDDQLRGRAGRQGDPGSSVLFVSVEDDLVVRHAQDAVPFLDPDPDGRLHDKAVDRAVEHAQRVAEGISFALHRNTWRYSVVTEQQRQVIAARRHDLLTTDSAATLLAERSPQRYEQVRDLVGDQAVKRAARSIALFHLDRCWADHLAELAEVREGVHLRALGRLDPLDEYHRAAVPAFTRLQSGIDDRIVATFDTAEITSDGWDLSDAGLSRPTATWTYMVHDNPFGSEMERFFTAIAKAAVNRR
ncbi:MAG: preprotein translocase subunit SecA [Micromonosporaceae bacterium]|nr:preprotein translocase subunit SecA [Micromonosporaceae bacterium]